MLKNCFHTTVILFFLFSPLHAQYYDTGEDPASIRWLQIKTGKFRVIYPESFGNEGIKFANALEESYRKLSIFYPDINVRIPVIIHNYTINSNGYVAWAPRRMEIYPTPEQNTIPIDNIEQLTLHEMGHVMQMSALNKGFSKLMRIPFGEQYYGALAVYIPLWFMEGDAVLIETLLSESGRGRSPDFLKQIKAISVEKGKLYSYDKMLHGSFRDYTPDEYRYGFHMVDWVNANFSHNTWNKALDYTAKYPFSAVPFNLGLSKASSLTKERVFRQTFNKLGEQWKSEDSEIPPESYKYKIVSPQKGKEYINYFSPVTAGRDSLIAIKVTMNNPPEFVLINIATGNEKRVHIPGEIYPYFLSGSAGKIVWIENQPDPRWANRGYSIIKLMDIDKGTVVQLSHRSRYMAAGLSADGRYICAVENTPSNENSIVIIDAFNGEVLDRMKVPDNAYPQRPQWSASGEEITFISLSPEGEGILSLKVKEKSWRMLKSPRRDDIQATYLRNDSLFFIGSASANNEIWLITPGSTEKRLTCSRFGLNDLCFSGNSIFSSCYTASGNEICRIDIGDMQNEFCNIPDRKTFFSEIHDSVRKNLSEKVPEVNYTPVPYRKLLHPFKFHSWMPFYVDLDEFQDDPSAVRPGFTILSQNDLSTLISSIGYEYSNQKNILHTRLTWKGWLPVIESEIDYGGNSEVYKFGSQVRDPYSLSPAFRFNNSISIPLIFRHGNFSTYLKGYVSSSYINSYIYLKEKNVYDYGQNEITSRFYLSHYSQSGKRRIYPKWATVVDYLYTNFPFDRSIYGTMSTLRIGIYIPGLLRNHGLRLRYESDYQRPEKLILYNRANFPRGYDNIISEDLRFFSADYVMPLIYPDLNIPSFLYIKRIRGGFFYDFAKGKDNTYLESNTFIKGTETFRSMGTELLADFFVLRIPFMISGGVQVSWKNINEVPAFKVLMGLDIYGMMIGRYKMQ
ncbi:MAG TPA: hypothetical protein PK910_00765 [Bacteroidales bacterium]|nr:hypothetical protein [Bacteroidales bacterium]HRC88540.1 hypothetical protein [Bacteroidales bacterium]